MIAFIAGVFFSIGLVLSGMINPEKVLGFLDVLGRWDASLAFVMGGAVIVNLVWHFSKKADISSFSQLIDKKLIIGSALFGIGWGLAGMCPGPAIVNIVKLDPSVIIFIISMFVGMFLQKKLRKS